MLLVASGIPFGLSRDPVGCMAPPRLRVRRDGQLPHRHRHQSWSFLIKSIQTDCWFESTSRIHPSTSEIYTVRSYLSCLSTLPCKWVSIIESQHASSDCLPHHSMLDHLDLLLSWAQQWEPDPFSILVVLKSIRSSRRQYLLNFQACRHLIAPPLQELCLGIIAKHLCIDCLKGWRATIHDLGTKDQTRSGNLSLMKTFENFTSTSTSAPEHKSSLGGMPVLGNAASQKTAVEFLPDCPILSADEKKRLLASTTALGMWRIVLLLSSAWPVPNHRKIKIMGKKWWLKSDAKAPLASDTGLHGQPLGHLPLFFSKFCSAKRRSNSTSCQLVPLRMSTVL